MATINRCKAIKKSDGKLCNKEAILSGYCILHFKVMKDKISKKKAK